jgi:hypothetical protein
LLPLSVYQRMRAPTVPPAPSIVVLLGGGNAIQRAA